MPQNNSLFWKVRCCRVSISYAGPNVRKAVELPIRWRGREGPESAHPRRCHGVRRRSVHSPFADPWLSFVAKQRLGEFVALRPGKPPKGKLDGGEGRSERRTAPVSKGDRGPRHRVWGTILGGQRLRRPKPGLGWHRAQWRDRRGYWHWGRNIAGCAVVSKPLGSRPPELVTRLAEPALAPSGSPMTRR
jgi:hypothetical protein